MANNIKIYIIIQNNYILYLIIFHICGVLLTSMKNFKNWLKKRVPNPPFRPSRPEAVGLRHLAFAVQSLDKAVAHLQNHAIEVEPIRFDEFTLKKFTFFADPDKLPIELYEL